MQWQLRLPLALGLACLLGATAAADAPHVFVLEWGSLGSGNGQFERPFGVATDAAGSVYVVDRNNHRIQKFTTTGDFVTKWGSEGSGDGQFRFPLGVATDGAGDVYVSPAPKR